MERRYVKNAVNINNSIEKTIEKNCDKKSGNAMNNTKKKRLRNRKKRLNVPFVRLTFQETKCKDTKEPNDIKKQPEQT